MTGSQWIDRLPRDRLTAEFSVWSADLVNLANDIARIEKHADILHIDVADGHFAPAMLFFPDLVASIRNVSRIPIHVHLMVADSILLEQIAQFADAGSELISFHVENKKVADEALRLISARGAASGMVLKVDTPVSAIEPFINRLNFVTLLGTAIGVKGQGLNDRAFDRLTEVRTLLDKVKPRQRVIVAADGGIRENTVPDLRKHGAETVVLGSLAFGAPDLASRMAWLRGLG
jgi:ribulose-phosphate 3-epimerase